MTCRGPLMWCAIVSLVLLGHSAAALANASAFAGVSMPTGNLADVVNPGYYVGGAYAMPVAPAASIGLRGAYNRWSWDTDSEGSLNSVEALAFGKVAAPVGPFGLVGLGLSSSRGSVAEVESARQTDFSFAVGGGYSLSRLEVTAMYHSISSEGDSSNYLTFSAGLGF
jgi:hypothetical protein